MAENAHIEPGHVPDSGAPHSRNFLKKCFQNSPWLTISVLLHVLIITLLAIARSTREQMEPASFAIGYTAAPAEVPSQIEIPPQVPDRMATVPPDELVGPVNLDPEYVPHEAAGPKGETDADDVSKDAGIFNPDPEASTDLASGAQGGTPIGVGPTGHSGRTSAFSSRKQGPGGRGRGGKGGPGGNGPGGEPKAEESVIDALHWLREHQSPDGHWDCAGFSAQCKHGRCDGAGSPAHDVGVTGLALLCFLGANETHLEGSNQQTVKNGLKYLISQQDEDGCFGPRLGKNFLYDHACAALAMTEAFGMTNSRPLQKSAQSGISFILRAQNPYSAWRYSYPPDGDSDTSVSGWMVMALKSAKMSGLKIDDASFQDAMNWITEMTDPLTGRTGYTDMGSAPSRLNELMQRFPAERSESLTAVGMLVRIFSEHDSEKDPMIAKGAELLSAKLPHWNPTTGDIDFYYWYYATLSMFQIGGPKWEKWNAALKSACIDHQRANKDECEFGSWDAIDPWSNAGGRVYSTAMNCLCMEVYYRYARVFGMPKPK